MKEGMLISFEGGEACGKSVQIKLFKEYLDKNNIDYIITREPGGTEVGESIRNILLHSEFNLSAEAEFLLFSASRTTLIQDVVNPALREGKVVILDRYFDSSYAYQGYAGNLQLEDIKNITEFAIKGTVPDLTFLIDITYEESMRRKLSDEALKNLDRFESKGKEYHDKVRNGYLKLAELQKERFCVIDSNQSREQILAQIIKEFENCYKKKTGN